MPIPVIDLFAGPGGLSEGFSSLTDHKGQRCFEVRLSIEKDLAAYRTLLLRSFFRSFQGKAPDAYYDYLRGKVSREQLFNDRRFRDNKEHAESEARQFELSEANHPTVSCWVEKALDRADMWVLIGGPPCQAYSIVGRSRMRSADPKKFEEDERHFLYREYLRIIADHAPPVFVMENVRGMLSSTIGGKRIFEQILRDLSNPGDNGLRYRIVPIAASDDAPDTDYERFVIRSELYGVPQTRHRVFLVGIRDDIPGSPDQLAPRNIVTVKQALNGLPPIRSRLSREPDSPESWYAAVREGITLVRGRASEMPRGVASVMKKAVKEAKRLTSAGNTFVPYRHKITYKSGALKSLTDWYFDPRLEGVCNHESRAHMRSDLHRYLFAAAYAKTRSTTPKLRHFPDFLLPNHENAEEAAAGGAFDDRFRVQVYDKPSTTVVSHIAKDGHYFIHPDPAQCRSLTVREVARLQTFPDNYLFECTRTDQYRQVGNAVPPLLANQIARVIHKLLTRGEDAGTPEFKNQAA